METHQAKLLSPLTIRGITFRNRIVMSPMCQYSSIDGAATDWHLVHLGARAVGGCALIFVEATAVESRGRISPDDMGIWDDKHIQPLGRIAKFLDKHGCVPGIQLAHAGRKACTASPWKGGRPIIDKEAWKAVGPSPIPFGPGYQDPHELKQSEIKEIVQSFVKAAERSLSAGFKVLEIHSAHGYLLHSFLSPISNQRTDEYGGSFENRTRLLLEVCSAVRETIGQQIPLFVRISASDWVDGGWDIEQTVAVAKLLNTVGVDVLDCSSGGTVPNAIIPLEAGYQVPFAQQVSEKTNILVGAVGLITDPEFAEEILQKEKADFIFLGRELLRDPYWAARAAKKLGAAIPWPVQYDRAKL